MDFDESSFFSCTKSFYRQIIVVTFYIVNRWNALFDTMLQIVKKMVTDEKNFHIEKLYKNNLNDGKIEKVNQCLRS